LSVLSVDSAAVRNPRPSHIKFRVGQVVRHKRFGYRGVIIGWDAVAKVSRSTVTLFPSLFVVESNFPCVFIALLC